MSLLVGQKVKVRDKVWTISSVKNAGNGGSLITLESLSNNHNNDLTVLYPIEPLEKLPQEEFKLNSFAQYKRWELLIKSIQSSLQKDSGKILCASRGRFHIEDYQLGAVLKSFARPTPRMLIADDVGLGKTVEAIMIMLELIARGRGNRILLAVPAGLQTQWSDELLDKTGIEFEIFDSKKLKELRLEYARGSNMWENRNRVITSIDFIKRGDIKRSMRNVKWDLVIIDEAHYLSESSSGNNVYRTDRSRLGFFLSQRTESLLLLTATPHNGYSNSFYSLLKLVDPYIIASSENISRERIDPVLVRRVKNEIYDEDGNKRFKDPDIGTIPVTMSDNEKKLYEDVCEYTRFQWRNYGRNSVEGFVASIIKKRLISSFYSLKKSLETRLSATEDKILDIKHKKGLIKDYKTGITLTEEQAQYVESELLTSVSSLHTRGLTNEKFRIQELLDYFNPDNTNFIGYYDNENKYPSDSKGDTLKVEVINLIKNNVDEKVIIFTEYKDTLDYLFHIFNNEPTLKGKVVTLTGGLSREDRKDREIKFNSSDYNILIATDAASEGLNLQKHCHILFHNEIPWNPNRLIQRNGRIDRWGQSKEKTVLIRNLLLEDTYDADILELVKAKLERIKKELGSVTEVFGAIEKWDIDKLMIEKGGIKEKKVISTALFGEIEQEIDSIIDENNKNLDLWKAKENLKATSFRPEDHQKIKKILKAQAEEELNEEEIFNIVKLTIDSFGKQLREVDTGIYEIDIPQELKRSNFNYPSGKIMKATFSKEIALKTDAKQVEYISPIHPLMQSISLTHRASIFDPKNKFYGDRVSYKILKAAPDQGILFAYLFRYEYEKQLGDKSVLSLHSEELCPVFVKMSNLIVDSDVIEKKILNGDTCEFNGNTETLIDLLKTEYIPTWKELEKTARNEALQRAKSILNNKREKETAKLKLLQEDIKHYEEDRKKYLEKELKAKKKALEEEQYDQIQMSFDEEDIETLPDKDKQKESIEKDIKKLEKELRNLETNVKSRKDELKGLDNLTFSENIDLVGLLMIIPDWYLKSKGLGGLN